MSYSLCDVDFLISAASAPKGLTLNTRFVIFSVNTSCSISNICHAKNRYSIISVKLARKPERVGVWGEGKVAFSYALWLPLPHVL